MAAWRRHRDLLSNAGSLVATTGVASLLGFVYWMFAARLFSQRAVGYGSAAVSAMTLLGTIGMLGLGTLLIGELPRRSSRAGLVSAALLTCGLGSLVLGLGFAVVAPHVSVSFADMIGTPGRGALFVAGVALTGVTLVFDQATIGLMRGGLQLRRNIAFAVAKLLVLPAAAIILHDQFGARDHRVLGGGHGAVAGAGRHPAAVRRRARSAPARLGRPAGARQDRDGPQLAEPGHDDADLPFAGAGHGDRVAVGERRVLRRRDADQPSCSSCRRTCRRFCSR